MKKFTKRNIKDIKVDYSVGDIFTIPANSKHKILAEGEANSEFYFVRIKI